jgi:phage recombination protein Bet
MTNLPTKIDYSDSQIIETLKNTVAVGATVSELALFIEYCKSTGLNPFKKEIWFIKEPKTGRLQMMTGINGFWTLANSFDTFDGAETGMIDKDGEWVKSVSGNDFIGAWCRVYRKDRRIPMEGEALLADYRKGFGLWQSAPRIMIKKVAESIALRKAFPQQLNGLYTSEEMPEVFQEVERPVKVIAPDLYVEESEEGSVIAVSVSSADTPPKKVMPRSKINKLRELETFYSVKALEGDVKRKAIGYLLEAGCKEIKPEIYRCAIKLSKLTSCIIAPEALEEGTVDVEVEEDFPNV